MDRYNFYFSNMCIHAEMTREPFFLFFSLFGSLCFVLTFLCSRMWVYYNQRIAVTPPDRPDTTLHLYCVVLCFISSKLQVSHREIVSF